MTDEVLLVTCARGTERALRFEIEKSGLGQARGTGSGAVELTAPLTRVAALNVELRLGLRVLWQQRKFEADSEESLIEQLAEHPFEEQLPAGATLAVEAHLRGAPWTHTRYAAQRVKDIAVDRLRDLGLPRPNVDTNAPDVRYVLHWDKTTVTFSLDTSGHSLNRRGYRSPDAAAPMRETLAAAILSMGHADVNRPFLDPCCGSGTLAIEQAFRALRRAPGLGRSFAFESWPFVDPSLLAAASEAQEAARARQLSELPAPISLSDYHRDAIEVARQQLDAAGLSALLPLERRDARKVELPSGGILVANLPFGERLGAERNLQLDGFYRTLGGRLAGGQRLRVLLFTAHPRAEELLDLGKPKRFQLMSGAISARLLRWDI